VVGGFQFTLSASVYHGLLVVDVIVTVGRKNAMTSTVGFGSSAFACHLKAQQYNWLIIAFY